MRATQGHSFFILIFAGIAMVAFAAGRSKAGDDSKKAGQGKEKAGEWKERSADDPVLKGFDPVLLTRGEEKAGNKSIAAVHNKFRYQFVSEENRQLFEKQPARYGIQLDGQCAAMRGQTGDPDLYAVHAGKIYIFGTPNCKTNFVANPKKYLNPPKKNVAIFVHEGVELLDFAGPSEVFAAAGRPHAFKVYTVAASLDPIVSQGFLTIKPQYSFENCPKPDIIVIPGGNTGIPLKDERVIKWIKKSSDESEVVLSVCTGAFLLAKAGLLDDKEATTHWGSIERLRSVAKKTKVHADRRFVDNGKIVTSAGVSAGIDGSLHVVARLLGQQAAEQTARYMEYRWEPNRDTKESVAVGKP